MNIFNGEDKEKVLKLLSNKNVSSKIKPWWMLTLQIIGTILLLILLGYFTVFTYAETFTSSLGNQYHWMLGWGSGIVSFIVAAIISKPIYISLGRAFLWNMNQKDFMILGTCILLVILSAYGSRNKFFAKDSRPKEICAALLPGDMPTIKGLGLGAEEGLTCLALSRQESSLALAIDRSKVPKEINPKTLSELEGLEPFSNGAVAIYTGEAKGSDVKIYDGPGFNPRRLGILLPISEDQLANYKASKRAQIFNRENAERLEKEREARAAAELAEKRRAAAEAEARRLEQERLAAQAAEERRIQAEKEAKEEIKRKEAVASNARKEWWGILLVLIVLVLIGFFIHPIAGGLMILVLLIHLSG